MSKSHPIFLLLIGTSLLSGAIPAVGQSFAGIYTGKRMLTKGDLSCPAEDNVSVTIKDDTLTFTDSNAKDYTISFKPKPDGSFHELSADIGGTVVDIRGQVADSALEADVISAHCQHHWHLERQ